MSPKSLAPLALESIFNKLLKAVINRGMMFKIVVIRIAELFFYRQIIPPFIGLHKQGKFFFEIRGDRHPVKAFLNTSGKGLCFLNIPTFTLLVVFFNCADNTSGYAGDNRVWWNIPCYDSAIANN
ncbi:MAG: hypothetical protein ACYSUK_08190 [Planctomycetota bacterium]